MFNVLYHDAAFAELNAMPDEIAGKLLRLVDKLQQDPRSLREPHSKPLGDGLFEIRTQGADIARGLWVYQQNKQIFILRFFIKKTVKTPKSDIKLALKRLAQMKGENHV